MAMSSSLELSIAFESSRQVLKLYVDVLKVPCWDIETYKKILTISRSLELSSVRLRAFDEWTSFL
jgi:hypothetical protein